MQARDYDDKPIGPIVPFTKPELESLLKKRNVKEVRVFMLQKGMSITIQGSSYKVIAARPNGKVTLKFKGVVKPKSAPKKLVPPSSRVIKEGAQPILNQQVLKTFDDPQKEKGPLDNV